MHATPLRLQRFCGRRSLDSCEHCLQTNGSDTPQAARHACHVPSLQMHRLRSRSACAGGSCLRACECRGSPTAMSLNPSSSGVLAYCVGLLSIDLWAVLFTTAARDFRAWGVIYLRWAHFRRSPDIPQSDGAVVAHKAYQGAVSRLWQPLSLILAPPRKPNSRLVLYHDHISRSSSNEALND
jgi:hypothetical protein